MIEITGKILQRESAVKNMSKMSKYEELYVNGQQIKDATKVLNGIDSVKTWSDAYWIGKCLYSCTDVLCDRQIIDVLENAFVLGLNINSAPTEFVDTTKILAELYFKYENYIAVINMLMLIEANKSEVPDWFHLCYASAQIHTDNLLRIADDPVFFFARLNKINSTDENEVSRRNSIYREFLILLTNGVREGRISSVEASKEIVKLAVDYCLNDCEELIVFRDTVCPDLEIPLPVKLEAAHIDMMVSGDAIIETQQQIIKQHKDVQPLLAAPTAGHKPRIAKLESKVYTGDLRQENERLRVELGEKEKQLAQLQTQVETTFSSETKSTDVHKCFRRNQTLLVIGDSSIRVHILRGIAKTFGFDNDELEFKDYNEIKTFAPRIQPYNNRHIGIIVGPVPHSVKDRGACSSFLQKIKGDGYPYVVEAREKSGKLKLTKESFREALKEIIVHLQSLELIKKESL